VSRSSADCSFPGAVKPCGRNGELTQEPAPTGPCAFLVEGKGCLWYDRCNLPQKMPWALPTLPLSGRMLT